MTRIDRWKAPWEIRMNGAGEEWISWIDETLIGYFVERLEKDIEVPMTMLTVTQLDVATWHHVTDAAPTAQVARMILEKTVAAAGAIRYGLLMQFCVQTGDAAIRDIVTTIACDEWNATARAYELNDSGKGVVVSSLFTEKALGSIAAQFAGIVGAQKAAQAVN
jgi:hypothetical protein